MPPGRPWLSGGLSLVFVIGLAVAGLASDGASDDDQPEAKPVLQDLERKSVQVYDKVLPAVVGIRARGSRGSGVIVSEDGLVLTAAHVFAEEGQFATVYLADGRSVRAVARGRDEGLDTGMLEIVEKGPWPFIELGDSGAMERGAWCFALGHPGGYVSDRPPVIRIGRLIDDDPDLLQTDCAIVSGDSGGPLVDQYGRLVGIHSRIFRRLSRNFHVPVDRYREGWAALRHGTPFLGVGVSHIGGGWYVDRVVPNSGAARAGLKRGDVILSIGENKYEKRRALVDVLRTFGPGEVIEIGVFRGGEREVFEVSLGYRKEFVE